jgi:hypothetical protein
VLALRGAQNVLNPKEQKALLEFIWCVLKRSHVTPSQRLCAEALALLCSFVCAAGSSLRAAAASSCRGAPSPRRASG